MNVLFHGNVRSIVMPNRKGKKGNEWAGKDFFLWIFSCPVCKVRSAFITPSKHWFENKDDKHHIVKKHKSHLK